MKLILRSILIAIGVLSTPLGVMAQSSVELDSFDLDGAGAEPKLAPKTSAASQLETCLVDAEKCASREFKPASAISMEAVVNLGIIDREQVAPSPSNEALPSIDIEILFDYNSDLLRPDQYQRLTEVANILGRPAFENYKFALLGHTDAKGGSAYNINLSLKRAESVSAFLQARTNLSGSRFAARGLGFSQLKSPSDPFGASNRRVQLVLVPYK